MAKQTIRYEQKQRARLSPTFVLWVNIVLGVATILACWYAFLYRPQIAYQLSGASIIIFIIVAAITLFISGTLSQSNLMKVFSWAISYIKGFGGSAHKLPSHEPLELKAQADDETPQEEKFADDGRNR